MAFIQSLMVSSEAVLTAATVSMLARICAAAQAEPFQRFNLLARAVQLFEIPESTSTFLPGDRAAARAATGLHGDPAVLWVGHLDRNKDPLTVLEGVGEAARMYFHKDVGNLTLPESALLVGMYLAAFPMAALRSIPPTATKKQALAHM
jgi:hypothetical protein